jgi:1-acyl-sn-glycerol-3-phosphate acyltransferase
MATDRESIGWRYRLVRNFFTLVYRLLMHVEVVGRENFYVEGACIVILNHLSVFDPPLVGILLPRRGWALAAEKYRRHLLFGPVARFVGVIFVRRGEVDRRALRAALKVLRKGGLVAIAPEGTRSPTGQLQQAKEGVAYLASRTGATILPVAVAGTEKVIDTLKRLRRPRVQVVIGEPFKLPPAARAAKGPQLATYTDLIMCRLAALLPESYRGYYRHRCASDGTPLPSQA